MNREELYNLINLKIDDIFLEYQKANGIKSGDITPIYLLRLDELQDQLTDLIIDVGNCSKK